MNTYYDKDSVAALNRSLGINLEEIINDPQLNDDQKFNAIYGKVLTALLNKWINNDTSGQLGLPEGFNVDEFVKQQVATVTETKIQPIANIMLMPDYVKELKTAKGPMVTTVVNNLFNLTTAIAQNERFDVKSIAVLMVECGALAISITGAIAATAALVAAIPATPLLAPTMAAAAGLVAAGAGVVSSFVSLLITIFTSPNIMERSFFGTVLNDTDDDLLIPNWKADQAKKKMAGIYCRHGKVTNLMIDKSGTNQGAIVGKRSLIEDKYYCNCGLYLVERNKGFTGTESLFRFDLNNSKFDVYSVCPVKADNGLDVSFSYVNKDMYDATTAIANEWSKHKYLVHEAKGNGFKVTTSLNDARHSPTYGIVCVIK